ncbi:hypothetical protein ACHAWO_003449 [Cyclotella atomus]|uniref:Arf-GAP domain-containing protein n=1 Tax=Cyclotella atomus TaxID=382360 RepID=A0ABD3PIQ9_9STRA
MPTTPEAAVKHLSRLPGNTICPNCGTTSKYGFSTVCIKYLTFVCNSCKTSHQAISHRCKSLTMSSWDTGEVLQLKTHGNEYARKVWLGKAPPIGEGGRPREGGDINLFKRFVVDVYEKKRYYVEPGEGDCYEVGAAATSSGSGVVRPTSGVRSAGRTITSHKPNVALQQGVFNSVPVAPHVQPMQPVAPAPVQAAAPAVDLLDFGAFDSAPPATAAPVTATPANDLFDPFNTNPPATSAPALVSAPLMQSMAVNQNGLGQDASFDPFGSMSSSIQPAVQSSAVPIMNNSFGMQNNAMGGMGNMSGMQNGGMSNMNGMRNGGMSTMSGMQNNTMMQNPMQQNMMGIGNMNSNMMMQNQMHNNMMMHNQMLSNMMMNGMANTNQMNTINGMNNAMNNPMMSTPNNSGMHMTLPAAPQPAMNVNIMQPMNNSISNNFGSKSGADSGKKDPFAGLGF